MSEGKSKRDLAWEKKKQEREERLRRQQNGDAGKEYPVAVQQQQPPIGVSNNRADIFENNTNFSNKPSSNDYPQENNKNNSNSSEMDLRGFQPVANSNLASGNPVVLNKKKREVIQASVVNKPIEVIAGDAISNGQPQPQFPAANPTFQQNRQSMEQQPPSNTNNINMNQQSLLQQSKQREEQEQRMKIEEAKEKEDQQQRKLAYRQALQQQITSKETTNINPNQNNPNNQQVQQQQQFQQQQQQIQQQQQMQQGAAMQKQELGEYLRQQMQQKNQGAADQGLQGDKKAQLQQKMQAQNAISPNSGQTFGNKNYARKNITNMYNQAVPMGGGMEQQQMTPGEYGQEQQIGGQFQQPNNNNLYAQQQMRQQQMQQFQQAQMMQQQQQQQQQQMMAQQQFQQQQQYQQLRQSQQQQQQQQFDQQGMQIQRQSQIQQKPIQSPQQQSIVINAGAPMQQQQLQQPMRSRGNIESEDDKTTTTGILTRGTKNFMKAENADMHEVSKQQQKRMDYQRELQRQIEEKARQKREEQEREKREEMLEEQRIQKEQKELQRQIDDENNTKKNNLEQVQKDNLALQEQKNKEKTNNRNNNNNQGNGSALLGNQSDGNTVGMLNVNSASKAFLNDEKRNEGIDARASLMDFYRKKSSQNSSTPSISTPISNSGQGQQQQFQPQQQQFPNMNMMNMQNGMGMNNMGMGNGQMNQMNMMNGMNNNMMGRQPFMNNNNSIPMMGGGMPMMNPMMGGMMNGMVNPQLMQQQQMMLAQQQAEILPQLYELRLQMAQQQMQMQQQIEFIKNQATTAIEERNQAEKKYQEIKLQYEQKQKQEKEYQTQLTSALSKNDPSGNGNYYKPHELLQKDLDQCLNPNEQGFIEGQINQMKMQQQQQQQQQPVKYQFHQQPGKDTQQGMQQMQQKQQELGGGGVGYQAEREVRATPGQNIQNNNGGQNKPQVNVISPANEDTKLAREAKEEYQLKMQQYGMKSLASDNKFIPLDILDDLKRKEEQISMSKLANYGVNSSQIPSMNSNQEGYTQGNPQGRPQSHEMRNINNNKMTKNPQQLSTNSQKWDVPSINSDITKEIDSLMNKQGLDNQFATQESFYQQNTQANRQQSNNPYNIQDMPGVGNQNVYNNKPPSRLGSNQSMRKQQNNIAGIQNNGSNAFGAAARGILGDSKAFQRKNEQTFKTNSEQEGYNLGSDFPDFSLNFSKNKNNGFENNHRNSKEISSNTAENFNIRNQMNYQNQNAVAGGNKINMRVPTPQEKAAGNNHHQPGNFRLQSPAESINNLHISGANFRPSSNKNSSQVSRNHQNIGATGGSESEIYTIKTNNFDIDQINQKNEERLKKLNNLGIHTINVPGETLKDTLGDDGLDKLDKLLFNFEGKNKK